MRARIAPSCDLWNRRRHEPAATTTSLLRHAYVVKGELTGHDPTTKRLAADRSRTTTEFTGGVFWGDRKAACLERASLSGRRTAASIRVYTVLLGFALGVETSGYRRRSLSCSSVSFQTPAGGPETGRAVTRTAVRSWGVRVPVSLYSVSIKWKSRIDVFRCLAIR